MSKLTSHRPGPCTRLLLAGTLLAGLSACGRLGERVEIKETRDISEHAIMPKAMATSAERFYESSAPQPEPMQNPLTWVTPPGWTEAPPGAAGGMRLIDLRVGDKGEGECYLSLMPGQAGGLAANVNRWRTQMGQPAYTEEELARLPKKLFVGRQATFVAFDGDFKGVGATEALKDYRMLGIIQEAPEFTLFVKMTGPRELVTQNEAAFDQFVQSISLRR